MGAPRMLGNYYYRDQLNDQAQAFYDSILSRFHSQDYSGVIPLRVMQPATISADCHAAFRAVRDDHPELFFLGTQYELTRKGDQATMKCDMLYTPDRIRRVQRQLTKRIWQITGDTSGLPQAERERIAYERIAKQLTYVNNDDHRDHNIVGPVLLSAGVCEGYNALLMLCLRWMGIPCIKVYGKSQKDRWHCWSIVWIHGIPVHCDVTWDKPHNGTVFFDYFNLSDDQISRDHFSFRADNIPGCTSEELNYCCLHQCSFRTQDAFAGYVRSKIRDISQTPIFAQLCFAGTEEAIQEAVNSALRSCKDYPSSSLHMNPSMKTAVLLAG